MVVVVKIEDQCGDLLMCVRCIRRRVHTLIDCGMYQGRLVSVQLPQHDPPRFMRHRCA